MSEIDRLTASDHEWEPDGKLGNDEKHIRRAAPEQSKALDDALGLQAISIRLQKSLIEDLKFIAMAHGIGYQPLARDILMRFAEHEKAKIIRDALERKQQELEEEAKKQLELEREAQALRVEKVA